MIEMPLWSLWAGIALAVCVGGMSPIFCVCLVVCAVAIELLRWAGWAVVREALADIKRAL